MNTRTKAAIAALLAVTLSAPAVAQDAETLRRELEDIEARRAEIVRQLAELGEEAPDPPTPPDATTTLPPRRGPAPVVRPGETLMGEVTVVARRFEEEAGRSPAAVGVIDAEWLDTHQVRMAADALRTIPGVTVSRSGTLGANTSVFVRGAGSNQTLVLLDGMPLNDPTVGGQANFFDLDALNLDRIEVLRGSYGALYGSDAIGGVVNLITRRGEGPASFTALAEFGAWSTHRESLRGSGGEDGIDWSFGASHVQTDGPHSRQGYEADSFQGRFGATVGRDGRLDVHLRWSDSLSEAPFDFGNPLPRDPNLRNERETAALGARFTTPLDDVFTVAVHASVTDIDSHFRNGPDVPFTAPEFLSTSDATTRLLGASVRALVAEGGPDRFGLDVVAGFDHENEESVNFNQSPFGAGRNIDQRTTNRGAFALATVTFGPVTLEGGGRVDDHSQGGRETSPQVGLRVDLEESGTVLRANAGEGFRAPTPIEFADPFSGNPTLGPEESRSWDVGIEQDLGGGVTAEATWFRVRTEDLIAFSTTSFRLENIARAENEGLEAGLRADLGNGVRARAAWLRQRPRDRGTGMPLANRPDESLAIGADWTRGDWTLSADFTWQGRVGGAAVAGPDGSARRHPGRKGVLDVGARWSVAENWTVIGRIENLLNETYVDTPTAPAGAPFGAFVGVEVDF